LAIPGVDNFWDKFLNGREFGIAKKALDRLRKKIFWKFYLNYNWMKPKVWAN
jgi:hypothetical protein